MPRIQINNPQETLDKIRSYVSRGDEVDEKIVDSNIQQLHSIYISRSTKLGDPDYFELMTKLFFLKIDKAIDNSEIAKATDLSINLAKISLELIAKNGSKNIKQYQEVLDDRIVFCGQTIKEIKKSNSYRKDLGDDLDSDLNKVRNKYQKLAPSTKISSILDASPASKARTFDVDQKVSSI